MIAVDMPNRNDANALAWYPHRTSVDAIEDSTGLDILNGLPAHLMFKYGHISTCNDRFCAEERNNG